MTRYDPHVQRKQIKFPVQIMAELVSHEEEEIELGVLTPVEVRLVPIWVHSLRTESIWRSLNARNIYSRTYKLQSWWFIDDTINDII